MKGCCQLIKTRTPKVVPLKVPPRILLIWPLGTTSRCWGCPGRTLGEFTCKPSLGFFFNGSYLGMFLQRV